VKLPHASAINQIAYVVPSIDAAVNWWSRVMGVGPFLVMRDLVFDRSDYLGEVRPVTYSAAISYSGDLNIELIEPSGPSIFADWQKGGKTGVQHICVFTENFAATEAAVRARGGRRIQGGEIGGGFIAYYDMSDDQSVVLELAQLAPAALAMFAAVRNACANWDGINPYLNAGELIAKATGK
jgi:hypothetical protein